MVNRWYHKPLVSQTVGITNRWYHPLKIVNCFKTHHRIERTKNV